MANVTYILGAGASHPDLPISEKLNGEIESFIVHFVKQLSKSFDSEPSLYAGGLDNYISIDNFMETLEESKDHLSVDTYAKKLTVLKQWGKLRKLKALLTIFFIFRQCTLSENKRYDSFIASIIDPYTGDLSPNIKVLTWNYDYLFERAYSAYCFTDRLSDIQKRLNVITDLRKAADPDKFCLFKLNGTCSVVNEKDEFENVFDDLTQNIDEKFYHKLLTTYSKIVEKKQFSALNYAWEDNALVNHNKTQIEQAIRETDIVVVIGYSFPFFNREVDRFNFTQMGRGSPFTKIYFQAKDKGEEIRGRYLCI